MGDSLKGWLVSVASALSVTALGMAGNLYVDVQLMKKDQERLVEISAQQRQMEELIMKLDKSFAVQAETLQALTKTIEKTKR